MTTERLVQILRQYGGVITLYTIALVFLYVVNADQTLHAFTERIVSSAAVANYSVAARLQVYFFGLALTVLLVSVLFMVCQYIDRWLLNDDKAVLTVTSYAGLGWLVIMLFTGQSNLAYVLYALPILHGLILVTSLIHHWHKAAHFNSGEYYSWLVAITLALVFVAQKYLFPWYGIHFIR